VGLFRTLDFYASAGITLRLWASALSPSAVTGLFDAELWSSLGLSLPEWVLIALGVVAMWLIGRATPRVDEKNSISIGDRLAKRPVLYAAVCALMVVLIAVFGHYGIGFDAMDFIYGQF
jgi:hypothetical protein